MAQLRFWKEISQSLWAVLPIDCVTRSKIPVTVIQWSPALKRKSRRRQNPHSLLGAIIAFIGLVMLVAGFGHVFGLAAFALGAFLLAASKRTLRGRTAFALAKSRDRPYLPEPHSH